VDIVASDASDAFLNHMTDSGLRPLHIDIMNINDELAGKYGNIITRGVSPMISADLALVRRTYANIRRLLSNRGRLIVLIPRTLPGEFSTIALHHKHNLWVEFREIRHLRLQVFPAPWYNKLPISVAVIVENILGRYCGICDVSILEAE